MTTVDTNQPTVIPPPVVEKTPPAAPLMTTKIVETSATPLGQTTTTAVASPDSGIYTTEFWKSIAASLVGLSLIVFGVVKRDDTIIVIGASLAGLSGAAYSMSRGLAKSSG